MTGAAALFAADALGEAAGEAAAGNRLRQLAGLDLFEHGTQLLALAIGEVRRASLGRLHDLDDPLSVLLAETGIDVVAHGQDDLGGSEQPCAAREPAATLRDGAWIAEQLAKVEWRGHAGSMPTFRPHIRAHTEGGVSAGR